MDEDQIKKIAQDGSFELIQTHISWLLLSGFVYKIKKPVRFSFLDFSTFEKRKFYCEEELRLNRRLSPEVYLDVVPVSEGGIDAGGKTVDHALKMKRLDESKKMDNLLKKDLVGKSDVEAIARIVAGFHKSAEIAPENNSPEMIGGQIADLGNFRETIEKASGLGKWVDNILRRSELFIKRNEKILLKRMSDGFVKDCHGDLHSGNIFLDDGIKIIDCIEFSRDFRCVDVASDIAFLAMDLDYSGRSDLADFFVERYIDETGDKELEPLLLFYKCYRANVRAKIASIEWSNNPTSEARGRIDRYVLLSERYSKGLV